MNWPDKIIDAVARRRCVLIIGSGVSAGAATDQGIRPPTWREFLEEGFQKLDPRPTHVRKAIKSGSYLEACQYIKNALGEEWSSLLKKRFLDPKYNVSELHKAIFDLDVRTTISLNFDGIYDKYAMSFTEGTFIVKKFDDGDIRKTVAGPDRYLIKMHGSVDSPSKMIFTAKEYAEARIKHREFYEVVTALLHTNTCLLIGCGWSDPDVKLLFEDYRQALNESPHYQTMPKPISADTMRFIKDTRGINILPYSARDGHKELAESVRKLGELASERRDLIATERSW